MKISAVPSLTQASAAQASKSQAIKMSVDQTPGPAGPQDVQELSIPDTNETKEAPEPTEPISPQFAALARQRRALQVKERELAEKEKAFEQRTQGSDSIPKSRIQKEPLSVLLEAGVTYDQLADAITAQQSDPKVSELEAKIQALEQGLEKKFTDKEQQAEQAALSEMKKEAERLIAANDEFELVRETGSVPDVMKLIERTYRETGEVLDVAEALKLIEDELFKRNQKIIGLKKIQALYQKPPEVAPHQRSQGMRTLTNKDTASVPMSAKQRALAAFYGTLKK